MAWASGSGLGSGRSGSSPTTSGTRARLASMAALRAIANIQPAALPRPR